jgi:MoaE-MoaD fusion protein
VPSTSSMPSLKPLSKPGTQLPFFRRFQVVDVAMSDHFIITSEALQPMHYLEQVSSPDYGAIASFLGTVRSPNAGEAVEYIDYEGYEGMIRSQMERLAQELRYDFDLGRIVFAHRLGRMYPGEASIAIFISSKHRKDALSACEHAINRAKELLPVWKHEASTSGKHWVEGSSAAAKTL